jgi:hypothetical protein
LSLVEFKLVKDELDEAEYMQVLQVLVRESLYSGRTNRPATLIVTDKALYFGGAEGTDKKFKRIPKKSINSASKVGALLWECIEVRHLGLEGEARFYLCPFTGSHLAPKKDREQFDLLLSLLKP